VEKIQNELLRILRFGIFPICHFLDSTFVSDFDIRISDFEFYAFFALLQRNRRIAIELSVAVHANQSPKRT
jgi:hypothetical protein